MMVQTWSTQHIRIQFVSKATGEVGYLNPEAMTVGMGRRWSSHPDMIKQYGRCVDRKLAELGVHNFSLHIDVWRSMNGRFQVGFDIIVRVSTGRWCCLMAYIILQYIFGVRTLWKRRRHVLAWGHCDV